VEDGPGTYGQAKKRRKSVTPPGAVKESRRIISSCLSGHQLLLRGEVRIGRPLCEERQHEVIDDPINHGIVGRKAMTFMVAPY
jgi:hypothetical protein